MGRVIAARLAADGFDVAVAYAGHVDLADATVSEIKEQGRHGAAFAADIADDEAVSRLCSTRSRITSGTSTWSCIRPGSITPST